MKRKYFRKCGVCGARHEQSDMVRDLRSPNGWFCKHFYIDIENDEHIDEDVEMW